MFPSATSHRLVQSSTNPPSRLLSLPLGDLQRLLGGTAADLAQMAETELSPPLEGNVGTPGRAQVQVQVAPSP